MLEVTIPAMELYDSEKEEFFYPVKKPVTLRLEHSLVSLQKWESKWHKPFLGKEAKTREETLDYVRFMCITPNIDSEIYQYIPPEEMKRISDYIEDPMTATWFSESKKQGGPPPKKEVITAEIVYYWMITLGIPSEYRKWHLNQLLTLIRVINAKNAPKKKRSKKETLADYSRLNAMRRAKYNKSKGR